MSDLPKEIDEAEARVSAELFREMNDEYGPGNWAWLRAWLPSSQTDGPFYGIDRTPDPVRFRQSKPRSRWMRLRERIAWAIYLPMRRFCQWLAPEEYFE